MSQALACQGAPRDLGLDQGRAVRAALRGRFGALPVWRRLALRAGVASAPAQRLARELARHFPHQAETLEGLAVGAAVPAPWLAEELLAELQREAVERPLAVARSGAGACVTRALTGQWLVRRSSPEGLFASIELTRPWLGCALLGVNERGLAVSVVAGHGALEGAPGALLAQDCLERFADLEAALEWCEGRPGGGRALLLLADASGEAAGIEIDAEGRSVLRPSEGLLAVGGAPGEAAELAKRLSEAGGDPAAPPPSGFPGATALAGEPRLVVGSRSFSL